MLDKTTPSLSQITANFLVKRHWQTLCKFISDCMLHSKSHDFIKDGVMEILGLTEITINHNALELIYNSIKTQRIEKDYIDYWFQKDQLLEGVQFTYQYSLHRIDRNKTIAVAISLNYKSMPQLSSNFFIIAARFGLLAQLEMLWNEYLEKRLEILQANDFDAFVSAAEEGQLSVLKFLWDKTPDYLKQNMLETEGYSSFLCALTSGQLDAVVFLWEIASDIQKENIFQTFIDCPTFDLFDNINDNAEFYTYFIIFLWNNITDNQKEQLIQKIIDDSFDECYCCFAGVTFAWDKACATHKRELLDKFINSGFRLAVINGYMSIIDFFWDKIVDDQRQLVLQKLVDYVIAVLYIRRIHTNAIPFLWDTLSNAQKELLLAYQEYLLFHDAASNATMSALITLWNSASHTHKIGILESKNYKVFDILFLHERLGALKILWSYTSLEQKEHILQKLLDWNNIDFLTQLSISSLKRIITILKEDAPLELSPLLQRLGMHCGIILYPEIYDEHWDPIKLLQQFMIPMEVEHTSSGNVMAHEDERMDLQTQLQHTGMFSNPRNSLSCPRIAPEIDEYTNTGKSSLVRKAEAEPDDEPDSKRLRLP